ncbi:trigger factor [Xanthobacter versatilis]|uniref:Trigger factor n=1 Tax=Xanthobacter autotrophicus (strain ATCC BAA-1158 / Py2) TaxID=78245 RepID=TIG_XANP2|nr:RecName: Full=Trigger factor; Short=TF; AltName: Full=PPIase [Xanthobacter autotrophicus Py2]ABS68818.1 trigger factor [Xanthobacter autotrophicus Py2]
MQVTETQADGLKRAFRVVVSAADLGAKADAKLAELKGQVKLNGFRPGKVPVAHLKRVYGKSVMSEVIEQTVNETNGKIVEEHGFKLALQPKVKLPEEDPQAQGLLEGGKDLAYDLEIEILPKIELGNFKDISVEKLVVEVSDAEVDETIQRIADANRPFVTREGGYAENGDRVTIDFTGYVDGEKFPGGEGQDIDVLLGSNGFIPGFEEQLLGVYAGDNRTLNVTFPEAYAAKELAGKAATFEVTVKSVAAPGPLTLDDEFAKTLGQESLEKLKEMVRARIASEHAGAARQKVKRALLDALDTTHQFAVPEGLVEQEFFGVWSRVQEDLAAQNRSFADEGTTEEEARADYRKIAERRVRLGLVLAEIGERNNIQVSEDEVTRAVVERARQFPGQEQQVWEYYRRTPEALASVRAPLFEEKVVDFLLELANVTEKTVTREELYKEEEDDEKAA